MRPITIDRPSPAMAGKAKQAGVAALAVLALAGSLASSEAQAIPRDGSVITERDGEYGYGGYPIIGYDCTGRPITRFDSPPTWCPPEPPEEAYL